MLYQGNTAKYQMADRMREAERARIARDVARSKGPSTGKRIATTVLSMLTLGLKH
jgi:hypothetical protein